MSINSPVKNEFRETLECPLCLNLFKNPKQLNCGHTYCLSCIEKLTQSSSINSLEKFVICPHCRESTQLPEKGLRTNFIVGDLVSKLEQIEVQINDCKKCYFCQKKVLSSDLAICKTCTNSTFEMYMCTVCALKLHKNHDILLMSDAILQNKKEEVENTIKDLELNTTVHKNKILSIETELKTLTIYNKIIKLINEYNVIITQIQEQKAITDNDLCSFLNYAFQIYTATDEIYNELKNLQIYFQEFEINVNDILNKLTKEKANISLYQSTETLADVISNIYSIIKIPLHESSVNTVNTENSSDLTKTNIDFLSLRKKITAHRRQTKLKK